MVHSTVPSKLWSGSNFLCTTSQFEFQSGICALSVLHSSVHAVQWKLQSVIFLTSNSHKKLY